MAYVDFATATRVLHQACRCAQKPCSSTQRMTVVGCQIQCPFYGQIDFFSCPRIAKARDRSNQVSTLRGSNCKRRRAADTLALAHSNVTELETT